MFIVLTQSLLLLTASIDTSQNQNYWINQLRSSSIDLKINAIEKLTEIKEPESFRAIASVLGAENSEVRYYAIRALSRFPTQESLNLLQTHLSREPDPYLKSEANRSIRSIQEILNKNAPEATPEEESDSESE